MDAYEAKDEAKLRARILESIKLKPNNQNLNAKKRKVVADKWWFFGNCL